MEGGGGEKSYAANSALQLHMFHAFARPFLADAVAYALQHYCLSPAPPSPFTVADLGCSCGPNTLHHCYSVFAELRSRISPQYSPQLELLYYFSDLPSNDFNSLFASLADHFNSSCSTISDGTPPPTKSDGGVATDVKLFTAGVPGSFYTRLFPSRSLRLVISSLSLHWLSQVPREVEDPASEAWNGGGVWLDARRPAVVAAYAKQSQQDLEAFLRRRAEEMASGGVLFLLVPTHGKEGEAPKFMAGFDHFLTAWDKLVAEGMVTAHERNTFNLPIYVFHPNELHCILDIVSSDFKLLCMKVFHDVHVVPNDVLQKIQSDPLSYGKFWANTIAAVFKPMVKKHIGDSRAKVFFDYLEQIASKASLTTPMLCDLLVANICRQ